MNQPIAIGTDIGGSHITCAAVNLLTGNILSETVTGRPVDNKEQAFRIVAEWAACVGETISKLPGGVEPAGIGFAMPGPFDYVNGIALFRGVTKYENLYGFNIADAIRSSLGFGEEFPVRFMNDATSFAMGEAWAGKSATVSRSVAITLGTGFGSAFIADKTPVVEGEQVPRLGCLYHLPFGNSIADAYFSTRWF
ncbi:MAG: ROK family protein, partial [Bacteroidetes bacterium]|nr:ROK family protein [Bacteroidota bacterium]